LEEEDILTTSLETSSSRCKTVDQARNGISISNQEQLEEDQPTNPLISTTLVNPTTCNTPQPTQDGGKSGSTTEATSATSETTR
jgi:hypothetical protein